MAAYIQNYEYDIFISYAHVDNMPFPGQAEGWIEQFYKNLNIMLARRFGRPDMVKIFWDERKLDGSVLFDQVIEENIKKSAILICMVSPAYISSDYCMKELDTFYKKAQTEKTGLVVGNRLRILNVMINNIPFTKLPAELSSTIGFPFYDAIDSEDIGDTLDTFSPEFSSQMKNLRDGVWNLLNEFPKEQLSDKKEVSEISYKEVKPESTKVAPKAINYLPGENQNDGNLSSKGTFICYSRDDSVFVKKLVMELRDAGANIWLDQLDIPPGSFWDNAVETALETTMSMVVVLSPSSAGSENVKDEFSFALENGKKVIPILIKDCLIPFRLKRKQHIDFTNNYQAGFDYLLRVLNQL